MTLSEDDLERIVSAVETIEESLLVLVAKQSLSRETYRSDREQRDVVERRFVKLTEATLDIAKTLVAFERGAPPESNGAENMRQKITPSPHGEDRSNGCVAQPSTHLFDRESGTFHTREQVVS